MSEFLTAFRERVNVSTREPGMASGPLHSVEDVAAGSVPIRVYRPTERPAPLVCYLHGAGFIAGDLDSHDQICRLLAARAGVVVVATDYRLAPEHPFPVPVEDALASVEWIVEHAGGLGAEPGRWALVGDSAGGTLAAIVAQRWRGRADGPALQVLVCPALEFAELDLDSHREFADTPGFNTAVKEQMADLYLGPDVDRRDPLVSPVRAESLDGLAPAVMITAELDPLRDDGEAYARRLIESGVRVTSLRHLGSVHYGVLWCRAAPEVELGVDLVVGALRSSLHAPEQR